MSLRITNCFPNLGCLRCPVLLVAGRWRDHPALTVRARSQPSLWRTPGTGRAPWPGFGENKLGGPLGVFTRMTQLDPETTEGWGRTGTQLSLDMTCWVGTEVLPCTSSLLKQQLPMNAGEGGCGCKSECEQVSGVPRMTFTTLLPSLQIHQYLSRATPNFQACCVAAPCTVSCYPTLLPWIEDGQGTLLSLHGIHSKDPSV